MQASSGALRCADALVVAVGGQRDAALEFCPRQRDLLALLHCIKVVRLGETPRPRAWTPGQQPKSSPIRNAVGGQQLEVVRQVAPDGVVLVIGVDVDHVGYDVEMLQDPIAPVR